MSTLYRQVCDKILAQISSGQRKVGDRLPPEAEFANELGVSRSTIRLAFTELETTGVLRRRKRVGTEIISAKPQLKFNMRTTSINELLSIGQDTEFQIQGVETVHSDDVDRLADHLSETDHWLVVSGLRTMNNENRPFGVNQVYVPARFAGIEPVLDSTNSSVFQVIEQVFDISVSRIKQVTSVVKCPEQDAALMGISVGAPILQIEATLYAEHDELLEVSVANYDPSRFRLCTDVAIE